MSFINICLFLFSDILISNIFDENYGTVKFLSKSIAERKLFQDANVLIFSLWIKILKYYGANEEKFKLHINSIIEMCVKFLHQGDHVSAKEREKATQVLQELFENKLIDRTLSFDITAEILKVFNIKKRPAMLSFHVFKLLGLMAKHYKHFVAIHAERIRDIYLKTLEDTILNEETVSFLY